MFVLKNMNILIKTHELYPRNHGDPYRLVLPETPQSAKYDKSCLIMCVRIDNKIPHDIKCLNIHSFKT